MSLEEDLLLTATKYLAKQKNTLDRQIASHLTLCRLKIENTGQYSNRWNCFWANTYLLVPFSIKEFFTDQVVKRIEQVLDELFPKDEDLDFAGLEISTQLEQSYEGWQEKAFRFLSGEEIPPETNFNDDFLRTVVEYLKSSTVDQDREIAINLTFSTLRFEDIDDLSPFCIGHLYVPLPHLSFFTKEIKERIERVFKLLYPKSNHYRFAYITINAQIEKAYLGWQEEAFKLLAGEGINNQASFKIPNRRLYTYDGMQFRSKAEVEIMKAFLKRTDCLVFPLPLARCGKIRREPDFLVCKDGKWAILEVLCDYTHNSVVKEAKRTGEFQEHLVEIRGYDEKECRENPDYVVNKFLNWLERRK